MGGMSQFQVDYCCNSSPWYYFGTTSTTMPATRTRTKDNGAQADLPSPRKHPKTRSKNETPRKSAPRLHIPLNPLPTLPTSSRPAADIYAWGKRGFGQLGLGCNVVDDILKPRKHPWVAAQVPLGTFGTETGAGVVSIASGGMHTYLLDENGTVCGLYHLFLSSSQPLLYLIMSRHFRYGQPASMTTERSVESRNPTPKTPRRKDMGMVLLQS